MADETHNNLNLDLNLGTRSVSAAEETINLDEWIDDSTDRLREAVRRASRQGSGRWHDEDALGGQHLGMDWNQFLASVSNPQFGQGSVAVEERRTEVEKLFENKGVEVDDSVLDCNEEDDKGSGEEDSFYDCNICFELAKDPIITCCGHLYCWSCIFQWLHHSEAKECPVCKGEVTAKNVLPIYGRGNMNRVQNEDLTLKIPPRPGARRVESLLRNTFPIPMEEMIRRLGNGFDLTRDLSANQDVDANGNPANINPSYLLNRLMTSRTRRRERIGAPLQNVVESTQSEAASTDAAGLSVLRMHTTATSRSINTTSASPSPLSTSDRAYGSHPVVVRGPEQSPPVDNMDSFSSIAAIMNLGSQTTDTSVDISSVTALSTSISSRRNGMPRASGIDIGDSRPPRRRRLD